MRRATSRTYVAASALGGRGVFAGRRFAAGEEVEVCPVIVVAAEHVEALNESSLGEYWYGWDDDGAAAIAMGHGSFYNHALDPTCSYEFHPVEDALVIRARRDIREGEELTLDYTGGGASELWFEPST
ncbi:MAG: SET domain-containing protein-lysine N-methyltransferase [Acidimicrobiales bacterium]